MCLEKKTVFKGCATALITPFVGDSVDFESLERLIEFQIKEGANAIVVCGTTGESATLSDDERRDIIEFAVKKANKRIPLIAGTGCNNVEKARELSAFASDCGADAVMTVTPYYNKASKLGLVKSFEKIADSVKIPVILYNVPSRTGVDIPLDVYKELEAHENIAGVKEASGNIVTVAKILENCKKLCVYSGNDDMALPVMALGGMGVVSVVSNIIPKKVAEMCDEFFSGHTEISAKIQKELLTLIEAMFFEVNPIPVKTAACLMGLCSDQMRLPLCELDTNKLEYLKNVLTRYGIIK